MKKTFNKAVQMFAVILGLSLFPTTGVRAQSPPQLPRITQAVGASRRVTLAGNTHPLAAAKYDAGEVPDTLAMEHMLLVLQRSPEQEAALRSLVEQQQTKDSPAYHKWLTPDEVGKQFGVVDSDIQTIASWLASNGFQVNGIAKGRLSIDFSGNAGQVRQAFGTAIHKFVVNGEEHWANVQDPQVPEALAPAISGIVSLNNFPTQTNARQVGAFSQSSSTRQVTPLFTFPQSGCSTSGNCFALTPQDFGILYNLAPLWAAGIDGAGQTIAIASGTNIRLKDSQTFRTLFGLDHNDPLHDNDPVVVLNGPDPGIIPKEEIEANLDVQWSGAIAKNAKIVLVASQTTQTSRGADLSAIYIVDNNIASILIDSYGLCEAALGAGGNAFYSLLWEQAAAEGITVVIPAGDTGASACADFTTQTATSSGTGVNGVASTPYNVAVGGTDFDQVGKWDQYWNITNTASLASIKSYIPEVTWNDTCSENGPGSCATVSPTGYDLRAGGGGPSAYYNKPAWQTGSGVPKDGVRDVPDVALFAGDGITGSFYIACQSDTIPDNATSCNLDAPYLDFMGIGGTSGAASVFAGMMALVNEKTNSRQGNANFVLYPLATKVPSAFHDITRGGSSVACVAGSPLCSNTSPSGYGFLTVNGDLVWPALPGFDLVTGLGTIDAQALVTNWSSVSFKPTTTTLTNVNPTTFTHGQPVSFQVSVTSAAGTPTGDIGLIVSSSGTPPHAVDFFPLANGTFIGSTNFLPGGTYTLTAHYAGDGVFGASDSSPVTITAARQASQAVLSVSYDTNFCTEGEKSFKYGFPYTIRVDVNLTGATGFDGYDCHGPLVTNAPTGTITITDNGAPFGAGTYALNSEGHIEDKSASLAVQDQAHMLIAHYSGDSSYLPADSNGMNFTIIKADTKTILTAADSALPVGGSTTVMARVGPNSLSVALAPGGTVTFYDWPDPNSPKPPPLGTATLVPGVNRDRTVYSTATIKYTLTGANRLIAVYGGDANYNGSKSDSIVLTVGAPDFSVAAKPSSLSIIAGQTGTSTLTVMPAFGFNGAVALFCPDPSTLPLQATCSISPTTLTPNGGPVTATISIKTTGPTDLSKQSARAEQPLPKWMVLIGTAGFGLATCILLTGGSKQKSRTILSVLLIAATLLNWSCAVTGHGNSSNSGQPVLTLGSDNIKSPSGTPVTLKAFVAAPQQVSGAVAFTDSNASLGQPVALTAGRAFLVTNTLALGTHDISATYKADGDAGTISPADPMHQVITGSVTLKFQATSGDTFSHPFTLPITLQ
jgi:hypothetical protein